MKVLFRFDATEGLKNKLASFSSREVEIVCCPENEDTAYERLLPQMDALWHVLKPVTAAQIAAAT